MPNIIRYWEIDLFRGIAILMMVLFHTLFDISYFGISPVIVSSGFWRYFAFATASLFLLIVGISFSISYARAARSHSGRQLASKFLVRGAGIFSLGLLVTVCTWLYLGEGYIIFGILHLIGVSIILAPLFYRFGKFNIIIGAACVLIGSAVTAINGPLWLLPLGIHPAAFWSVDYTPLFPWFGVVLIGIGCGVWLYPGGVPRYQLLKLPASLQGPLTFPGRYSLWIYLAHQPVIIVILHFLTGNVPL
jgi:uncharacterized membrane protein